MAKGCLVIHGLTGTPATVAILQDKLLAAGYRVAAPCLAGHGGSVEELGRSGWHEWYATVRIAYDALRREAGRVCCAGLSLGALLVLKLALDEGWGVRALALLSTPVELSWFERAVVPAVRYSPLRWLIRAVPKNFRKSVGDDEGRRTYEEFSLPAIPMRSVIELIELQREVRAELGRISNPLLLLHGRADRVAPLFNVALVKGLVASGVVEARIFDRSRHLLTLDADKEAVAHAAVDFFERFA